MTAGEPVRLIMDADHGIDDAMATLYLASRTDVEIVAVGTVHGNAHATQAANNAEQVLRLVGLGHVPVVVGAETPLAQGVDIAVMVHGEDGLGGQAAYRGPRSMGESAAGQLVRLARESPGEYQILATGPLTNIALALLLEPDLPRLIRRTVIMGGAIGVPGNTSAHTEANIWHDPEAAALVLSRMTNVVLVPLDVTQANRVGAEEMRLIDAAGPDPANRLLKAMLVQYERFNRAESGRAGFPLHDPTAAILTVLPDLAEYLHVSVQVELRGEHTRGMLVADRRPGAPAGANPIAVAMVMDPREAVSEFLKGAIR